MATTVVNVVKISLDDDKYKDIECKSLKVKYLREFMTRISDLQDVVTDNVASIDVLLDCCEIALRQYVKGGIPKEELEELLDLPTMYRIVEGASGIVLDATDDENPNQ
jgi:hypothetical protein